jgi:hypothetical protein
MNNSIEFYVNAIILYFTDHNIKVYDQIYKQNLSLLKSVGFNLNNVYVLREPSTMGISGQIIAVSAYFTDKGIHMEEIIKYNRKTTLNIILK